LSKTKKNKITPKRTARVTKKAGMKKAMKVLNAKPVKKINKPKRTAGPKYIQPTPARTKKVDVPVPYKDTDKVPPHLLRTLVDTYYDFQGQRIQTELRIAAAKRNHGLTEDDMSLYGVTTIFENAQSFERDLEKIIKKQLLNHAMYTQYLVKILGIGPILSAGLISYVDNIERFKHVSSLWQFVGYGMNTFCSTCKTPNFVIVEYETGKKAKKLHPMKICDVCGNKTEPILQKRTVGYQSNWNDRLKTLCWNAGSSFVKQSAKNSGYRKLYDQIRKEERRVHPKRITVNKKIKFNDGHIHNRTMRKVVKIFLAHFWQTWQRQQGLPANEPYVNTLLGHSTVEAFTDN